MAGRKWNKVTLASAALAILWPLAELRARDEKGVKTLCLETKHFQHAITGTAKTVGLDVELNGKGEGKGTLHLDPNLWLNDKVSTLIRVDSVKVTLKEVQADESAKKGRRVYEISGKGLDRLRLMVPTNADGACWLMIGGKEGPEDIVEMRPNKLLRLQPAPFENGGTSEQ